MKRAASGILPLIAIDRKAAKPLHTQIYDAYRTGIVSGRFRPGQRIPSTRVLATELEVSRFPVLNAYAQLLAEGYFESRVGAGTVVSSLLPDQLTPSKLTRARVAQRAPDLDQLRAALPPFAAFKVSPVCRAWAHFAWDKWHPINSPSVSGRIWSRTAPAIWTPARFITATTWASGRSGK